MKLYALITVLLLVAASLLFISCNRSQDVALAPPDTNDTNKVAVLIGLRTCKTREEWAEQYLKQFPDAHPLAIIGDYNSDPGFTKRWKPFSLSEMQALVHQHGKNKATMKPNPAAALDGGIPSLLHIGRARSAASEPVRWPKIPNAVAPHQP